LARQGKPVKPVQDADFVQLSVPMQDDLVGQRPTCRLPTGGFADVPAAAPAQPSNQPVGPAEPIKTDFFPPPVSVDVTAVHPDFSILQNTR
jgi:hypothetical protein